ncbi:MAG: membrane-bound lytic murein transglycosylase MltF [Gammaproteobacteria bacterium]|nr:membrane-bound lytic murein transglycosylase MltF [Gammaproteobacteria bacterium]
MHTQRSRQRWAVFLASLVLVAGTIALYLLLQRPSISLIDRIRQAGELVVATRHSPTTFFAGAEGTDGFSYELVERFAAELGVSVRYTFPATIDQLLDDIGHGRVHMAAARLGMTEGKRRQMRFSLPFTSIEQQLVYRRGDSKPNSFDDIGPGQLFVIAGSSHEETLRALRETGHPSLAWVPVDGIGADPLLARLDRGEIRMTLADANEIALHRRIYRHIAVAFDLDNSYPVAWGFPPAGDDSLREAANRFLQSMTDNGSLQQLQARFFGHNGRLNFVDTREFWRQVRDRLPRYRAHFEEAAELTGIDWRLLAAIGYQESHWQADAVSPTGVRGIMMLTQGTAKQMGLTDRDDPRQSIIGGARYLRVVERKIPERIAEPNRLWLTLAGYNIGFGHLEDARVLTQRDGGDPDLWMDVKKRLPLLAKKAHYKTVRYGFARGQEPVDYVDNIRNYYDMLVWFTTTADDSTRAYLLAADD